MDNNQKLTILQPLLITFKKLIMLTPYYMNKIKYLQPILIIVKSYTYSLL